MGDDPAVLRTLVVLDNCVGAAIVPAGVAMFLGATGAILTTRALPAWLGWLAGVTAVLLVVSLGGVFDDRRKASSGSPVSPGSCSSLVWVLATSIVLLMKAGREIAPTAQRAGSRRTGRLTAASPAGTSASLSA